MDGLVIRAPLNNPRRMLDIGCGTGVVTCHLGKIFPDAKVHGVDLSPVPAVHAKPENVLFSQGIMPELAYAKDTHLTAGSFDFVFSRLLIMGMNKWVRVFGMFLAI